ncbi:MAG: Vgb family protein, partial [Pseudomonadales bacterium]
HLAMVTRTLSGATKSDTSDNGYPNEGIVNKAAPQVTRFTNEQGMARFAADTEQPPAQQFEYRVRKQGYKDGSIKTPAGRAAISIVLEKLSGPLAIANSKPSNLWLSQLSFDWHKDPAKAREHFLLHCAYCHQQASVFMRSDRSEKQWLEIIERMNLYGAQVAADFMAPLAEGLTAAYPALTKNYDQLPPFEAWQPHLSSTKITEWAIGDGFSQMHDFILHPNGKVYVGDNLMDRIYEVDPHTGEYVVYKVPHAEGEKVGGILGNRLKTYPKTENYLGVHSFALSPRDGHLFITPSMQRQLLEFDPGTKAFTSYAMDDGFYPHTIRADANDNIWFTLALSSQVAMFDRKTKTFTYYGLPPRGMKERVILWFVKRRLAKGDVATPPDYDWVNSGFPMPYGIDVSPVDGNVWVGRLYADDIARIDPATGKVTMIETPFKAPRRLRCDADGNVWIVSFSTGKIAKYDPRQKEFSTYDLPLKSETPYSLNVDRKKGVVWVNGNQSDTLMAFDIKTEEWKVYPMSRRRTFTRDIEIGEDGSVYTSNSNFPSWQIEDGQPTLIRVQTDQ